MTQLELDFGIVSPFLPITHTVYGKRVTQKEAIEIAHSDGGSMLGFSWLQSGGEIGRFFGWKGDVK